MYKRPFMRIVEPTTKAEISLFTYRIEDSVPQDAILIGGMYFANDNWMFAPVVKKFQCERGFEHASDLAAPLWAEELSQRGLLSERMTHDMGVVL
jgi:stress response protein SCP2